MGLQQTIERAKAVGTDCTSGGGPVGWWWVVFGGLSGRPHDKSSIIFAASTCKNTQSLTVGSKKGGVRSANLSRLEVGYDWVN